MHLSPTFIINVSTLSGLDQLGELEFLRCEDPVVDKASHEYINIIIQNSNANNFFIGPVNEALISDELTFSPGTRLMPRNFHSLNLLQPTKHMMWIHAEKLGHVDTQSIFQILKTIQSNLNKNKITNNLFRYAELEHNEKVNMLTMKADDNIQVNYNMVAHNNANIIIYCIRLINLFMHKPSLIKHLSTASRTEIISSISQLSIKISNYCSDMSTSLAAHSHQFIVVKWFENIISRINNRGTILIDHLKSLGQNTFKALFEIQPNIVLSFISGVVNTLILFALIIFVIIMTILHRTILYSIITFKAFLIDPCAKLFA